MKISYEVLSITPVPSNREVIAVFYSGYADLTLRTSSVLFFGNWKATGKGNGSWEVIKPLVIERNGKLNPPLEEEGVHGLEFHDGPETVKWKEIAKRHFEREKAIAVKKKFNVE